MDILALTHSVQFIGVHKIIKSSQYFGKLAQSMPTIETLYRLYYGFFFGRSPCILE